MNALVVSVSRDGGHRFNKQSRPEIRLIEGFGVEGDVHAGVTVQHLSRIAKNPAQPNLHQVHLIHAELHDELNAAGFDIHPGDMGENILTRGLDLLALPQSTLLHIGAEAIVEITGLLKACLERTPEGQLIRKAGVMAIVHRDGVVRSGDALRAEPPKGPHLSLQPI